MTMPTVRVRCVLADAAGLPVANALISAKLSGQEVAATGYVLPAVVEAVTDADGLAVLVLWPNQLGATQSFYDIKIVNRGTGKTVRLVATIPATDCNLHEVAQLPPFDGKSDGQLAVEAAIAAVVPAIAARDRAELASGTASVAAVAAEQGAVIAVQARTNALEQAQLALAAAGVASVASAGVANGVQDAKTYAVVAQSAASLCQSNAQLCSASAASAQASMQQAQASVSGMYVPLLMMATAAIETQTMLLQAQA